jgi:hypothetical protein
LTGHCENAEIELRVYQAARLVSSNVHAELLEKPKNGTGFNRAWGVVITGYERYRRARQLLTKPLELAEGEYDC